MTDELDPRAVCAAPALGALAVVIAQRLQMVVAAGRQGMAAISTDLSFQHHNQLCHLAQPSPGAGGEQIMF
jgi:hypothetical protein